MNNNTKYVMLAVGLVVGLVLGFFMFRSSGNLGAVTVSNQGGLDQQALINELQAIANVTGSLSATTTANYGPGPLGPFASTTSTVEKNFTVSGAAVGDYVLVGLSTSTQNINVTARVSAANTVAVDLINQSTTATTVVSSTYDLTIVPFASFQPPVGL